MPADNFDSVATNQVLLRTHGVTLGVSECGRVHTGPGPEECEPAFGMIVPMTGSFVRHVEGTTLAASPATVLLTNQGETHRTSHPHGGGDRSIYLSLAGWQAEPLLRDDRFRMRASALRPRTQLELRSFARSTCDRTPGDLDDLTQEIVGDMTGTADLETTDAHRCLAGRATEYLTVHFAGPCTIRIIARELDVSPHHLSRVFRSVMGTTITDHRMRLRLGNALGMLLDGADDISFVAFESGFYDHAHLTRSMSAALGIPPREVRSIGVGR